MGDFWWGSLYQQSGKRSCLGRNHNNVAWTYRYYYVKCNGPKLYGVCKLGRQNQKKNGLCDENISQASSFGAFFVYIQQISCHKGSQWKIFVGRV